MVGLMMIQVSMAGGALQALLDTSARSGQPLSGGYVEPSEAGVILVMIVPWIGAFAITSGSRRNLLLALGLVGLTIAMITRSVLIALVLEFGVFALLAIRSRVTIPRLNRYLVIGSIAAAISLALLAPQYMQRLSGAEFGRAAQTDPDVFGGLPLEGNALIYIARGMTSISALIQYPFGIGGFNAPFVSLPFQFRSVMEHPTTSFESLIPFVSMAVQFGVPAALAFIAALAAVFSRLVKGLSRLSYSSRILMMGFIAAFVPGLVLGTFAPGVPWLGSLTASGDIELRQTLFNGKAVWALITVAMAFSFYEAVAMPREPKSTGSVIQRHPEGRRQGESGA
jgi:hypothetical protein